MELGFLDNKEEVKSKVTDIKYNEKKADLKEPEQYPIPLDLPYMQHGIEYVKKFGYKVCFGLKIALINRANKEKVVTIREADIANRRQMDFDNKFLMSCIVDLDGFLSEDNQLLTEGVFHTRVRYNKGLLWRKLHSKDATQEQREVGEQKISVLDKMLEIFGLPLHPEERVSGLHQEMLKPEFLNWEQFNSLYREFMKGQTLGDRLKLQEIENLAKELLGTGE